MTNIYPGIGWGTDHKAVPVKHPNGAVIDIDEPIAPLMALIWGLGITTTTSCEDNAMWTMEMGSDDGEEWVLVGFNSAEDAERFVVALDLPDVGVWAVDPEPDTPEDLAERASGTALTWDDLREDNWNWLIWFEPHEQARPDFKMRVELRFPRSDLPEVVKRLEEAS